MKLSKREFLQAAITGTVLYAHEGMSAARSPRNYLRIACEEAFSTKEVVAELSRLAGGVPSMKSGPIAGPFMPNLLDLGEGRVQGMDAAGVDVQILSLSSPGVQTFEPATAVSMAREVNNQMAEYIRKHPTRFGGLATIAPQAPAETIKELERCIRTLGLNGGMINSHTNGEYLDNKKYWPILEAFEALNVPLYIHPRDPVAGLEAPLAIPGFAVGWGYAVETCTHVLHMIAGGVFDQFPKLRVVLGHLGETLPFLLNRMDNRYVWQFNTFNQKRPLQRLPSEYFRDNFVVTSSGMNYSTPLKAAIEALGADKVLFSVDHPMEDQKQVVEEAEAIKLPADVKKKFYETNARRVFKLQLG